MGAYDTAQLVKVIAANPGNQSSIPSQEKKKTDSQWLSSDLTWRNTPPMRNGKGRNPGRHISPARERGLNRIES